MRSYTLIVNTKSDSGRARSVIETNLDLINPHLNNPEIIYVEKPSEIENLTKKSSQNSDCIIACGGDGTMQSVARGLYGSNCLMGVIPIGSGNDFVKSLGISPGKSLLSYLKIIQNEKIRQIDIPVLNDKVFVNTVGIGFDGLTNYLSAKSSLKGSLKYLVSGFKAFLIAKPLHCKIKSDSGFQFDESVWMIAIANGTTEGGKYKISPTSDNSDGMLELVLVPAYNRLKLIVAFILLSLGISLSERFFSIVQIKSLQIEISQKHYVHMDGEVEESSEKYKVDILSEKLKVIGN